MISQTLHGAFGLLAGGRSHRAGRPADCDHGAFGLLAGGRRARYPE